MHIHPLADVQTNEIGENTRIWQFCVVLKGAIIGKNCNICANVFIENNVIMGNNVTVKCGVMLWDGITIEDDVFISQGVMFATDIVPRSKRYHPDTLEKLTLRKGCTLGANSTIVAVNSIGEYSVVGAGSVLTKDVPPHTLWYGNPAVQRGFVTKSGITLDFDMRNKSGEKHSLED